RTLVIKPSLSPAPAKLHVVTDPPGAQVTIGGVPRGDSPLDIELPAQLATEVAIVKPGFEPQRTKVDLLAGKPAAVSLKLKEIPKLGTLTILVTGSAGWAEVRFKGKSLGRTRTAQGLQSLHLPVGHQTLELVNLA